MELVVKSEEAMKQLGERLAAQLPFGTTLELVGDVGAGKTTFTKGLAKGLGADEDVQSPSFTISRVYELPNDGRLYHYDFYRLNDAGILKNELAEVADDPKAITVIEWADIVSDVLPEQHVRLSIKATDEHERLVTITGLPVEVAL